MDETMCALRWLQGDISGVLEVAATTKASELKILLGAEACAAVMHNEVNVVVKLGAGPFKKMLDVLVTEDPNTVVQPSWSPSLHSAFSFSG